MLSLALPTAAQPLALFESALEEHRLMAAERLIEQLPEGPEKLLARAQFAMATQHPEDSFPLIDQLRPDQLPPPLLAKYLLITALQHEVISRHGTRDDARMEALLQKGLDSTPSRYDKAELLLVQLRLARKDSARTEQIVQELFEISPAAGFSGRLRMLLANRRLKEVVAWSAPMELQARSEGRPELARYYGLATVNPLFQLDRYPEAHVALQSMLDEALASKETGRIFDLLRGLSHSTKKVEGRSLDPSLYFRVVQRLGPGDGSLRILFEGMQDHPENPSFFEQGLTMARNLDKPLVTAAFLLSQAQREKDEKRARDYERQARQLIGGRDLRGVGSSWYGYDLVYNLPAAGLDSDDDLEIWPLYRGVLRSGRAEGEIAELRARMLNIVPDRQAAWVWVEPMLDSIVEGAQNGDQHERSRQILTALGRISHAWVVPRESGQASTFAPREATLAATLGSRLAEDPRLVEELLSTLAEIEQSLTGADSAAHSLSNLGELLASLGRTQEAFDLFTAAHRTGSEYELLKLRQKARLAGTEHRLGLPSAEQRLLELASVDFGEELSPFDQPWRRATELAWLSLEQGAPARAERLARQALAAVPKNWPRHLYRRLGAYEVLAFALAAQGRHAEVEALLAQWSQEQGVEGQSWLAILQADLLLRAGKAEQAAQMVPAQAQDEASSLYLTNLRRQIYLATGQAERVSEMEREFARQVEAMMEDRPRLRRALLNSPAYTGLAFLTPPPPLTPPDNAVRGDVDHLEKVIETLELLRRREPDNQELAALSATRVRDLAQAVRADQVVVRPVLMRHSVVLLVASGGRLALWERFLDVDGLRQVIARLGALVSDPNTSTARLEADGDHLSARLLDPWRSEFPGRRHLLWLAQGELKELPLALLRLDGKPLLETMTVTYLDGPSSGPAFSVGKSPSVLLIGGSDDLPGAREELAEVRGLLPRPRAGAWARTSVLCKGWSGATGWSISPRTGFRPPAAGSGVS